MKCYLRLSALSVLLLLLTPSLVQAQDGPVPLPPSPLQGTDPGPRKLQEEMKELFLKVETNLQRIDEQLADAGAGEVQLEEVPDAGLDDLLRAVQERGQETKTDIDRILEIAQQLDQSGSGGGSSSGKKPGQDSSPGNKPSGQQKEENTPQAQKPGESEEEHGDSQEKPGDSKGDEPKDGGQDDEQGGQNREGNQASDGPKAQVQHGLDADKWGFLPERQKRTFRNQGRDNLPVQYRQWIDTYYRRLNQDPR